MGEKEHFRVIFILHAFHNLYEAQGDNKPASRVVDGLSHQWQYEPLRIGAYSWTEIVFYASEADNRLAFSFLPKRSVLICSYWWHNMSVTYVQLGPGKISFVREYIVQKIY